MNHLSGNVISATVGLIYINLQPEYELPSSSRFGQFPKIGKFGVAAASSPASLRKHFLHRVRVLVRGYVRVRLDLLSCINFRNISDFPLLGVTAEGP